MKLISIPANPVPEGVVTGELKTRDGISLRFARWAPPPGRKGTVCIFHGRAEFIEKYFEAVRELRSRGFAVVCLDWRGQGMSQRLLSDPRKGHVADFSDYEIDLETLMREVVLPDCPPPIYALGHSMGASVLLRAAYRGQRWFDRMVLSAPMVGFAPERDYRGYARPVVRVMRMLGMGAAYIPGGGATVLALSPFAGNPVTSDPVRYARSAAVIDADISLGIGSPTVGWAGAAFDVIGQFGDPAYAGKIRQPLLIVGAGRDEIVSTPAIEEFAVRLRAGSHLVVAGARHEILMEQDRFRGQFWAAFDAFVPGTPLFG